MHLKNYEKNTDTKEYKIVITPTAYREIDNIYEYIIEKLYNENAAKNLMREVENSIQNLKNIPKIHGKIEKVDDLKRNYRKIIVKNYIILYTIDEEKDIVYISHMYYRKRDYQNNNLLQ